MLTAGMATLVMALKREQNMRSEYTARRSFKMGNLFPKELHFVSLGAFSSFWFHNI